MDSQKLQDIAYDYLMNAQIAKERDGFLAPLIVIVNDTDEIRTQSIILESDEDVEALEELLHKLSEISQALMLINDAYILDIPDDEKHLADFSIHPDARQYIHCFIYTKENTFSRRMPYTNTDGNYLFHDLGWDKIVGNLGNYQNPFFK